MDKTKFPGDRAALEGPQGQQAFPKLGSDFEVLGPSTPSYNCIAHTLGDHSNWVNPVTSPTGDPLAGMDAVYGAKGYHRLPTMDTSVQPGHEKVVVYATKNPDGSINQVTHGAIQQPDGTYTSKLGQGPLIRHADPDALDGPAYGEPVAVYEK
jgi:type VI secretion system secreted protein VgrG